MLKAGDLPDQIGPENDHNKGQFLRCPRCKGEYSANRGDYFYLSDDHPMKCSLCHAPLILCVADRIITTIKS